MIMKLLIHRCCYAYNFFGLNLIIVTYACMIHSDNRAEMVIECYYTVLGIRNYGWSCSCPWAT